MGSKTSQQTSAQTTTPVNQAALQQIYGQVASAAQTPYTPYSGEMTAGINGQQTAGINTINGAANSAQPYYSQAAGLASSAANPLTAAQIQQYQNPYTQNVVNATQAQFNDQNGQQQNSLKGTAAQQGALGGDRQAVAQSQLAGQQQLSQAPVIAGLYANSYNSGLQTAAQQYQTNPLAASSALSGIGTNVENAGLAGGAAQLAAGTQQQQTQQAGDTANYNQYLAQQANPYQNAAFLEQYGLPAALGQGSTSNGTQTTEGPSNLGQIAGLGIAGAGLFLKDGGNVSFASGGAPGYINSTLGYIDSGAGYIPHTQASQNTLQAPSLKYLSPQQSNSTNSISPGGITSLGNGLKNDFGSASYGGGNMFSGDAWGGDANNPLEGLSSSDYGMKVGGLVHAIHSIHKTIKRARGGSVTDSMPFASFDDGGATSFDDRFSPAVDNPFGDMPRGQALALIENSRDGNVAPSSIPGGEPAPSIVPSDNSVVNPDNPFRMPDAPSVQAWRDGVDTPNPAVVADSGMPDASGTAPNPMVNPAALPPQITNPDHAPEAEPSTAMAFDSGSTAGPMGANGQPTVIAPISKPDDSGNHFGHSLFGVNISDKNRQALVAAGLGMLASRSPFAGVALGEGGLKGLQSLSEANKAEMESADKAQTKAQEQQRIDLQAKQIAQNAAQFAKTNSLAERREKFAEDKTPAGYRAKDDGNYEAIPGGPADPAVLKAAAEAKRTANAVLDDDTIHDMADQYLAGDRTVMQNLGRGSQGAENIVKLRQAIAQHARDQGVDPAGIVNKFNEQAGALAGQRTVGARAANISLAANEANNMIPIALEASDKLPRTQWMPWNQAVQAYQKGSSSPELASFVAATNSLVNSYVRAVSPSGVPTDSMRQHAYDMLNAAQGPEAYKAVVVTMQKEMQAALQAPGQVKAELRKGNEATAAGSQSGAPAAPPPPATKVLNGVTYVNRNGQWFQQ